MRASRGYRQSRPPGVWARRSSRPDTRREVAEQIHSLGAKYIGVESEEDAATSSGYAKELSQDFYKKQGELIAKQCAMNDVVITTALIGGVKAPKLDLGRDGAEHAARLGNRRPGGRCRR